MVDITWSLPEIPPNGAHHPPSPRLAFPWSARRLTRTSQNWYPYERTQHVIENKGREISEPSMLLKRRWLALLTQQVDDGKHFTS
ncbi:MAG TPA: hypothetical protein VMT20_25380, partial [Terriglobia bacterium]|nr:hypothetical protein [Terriglobia bacterium]